MDPMLAERLAVHRQRHRHPWRELPVLPKGVADFSSNDYLGLATDPLAREAARRALNHHGVGSGASPLVGGRSPVHEALEEKIASALGTQRALTFSSGYAANIGLLSSLMDRNDVVVADRLVHASLIDGVTQSGANLRRFQHQDLGHAATLLTQKEGSRRWLLTDGVFSMDGDQADVAGLLRLARTFEAPLVIDDAHGFGVVGDSGLGVFEDPSVAAADCAAIVGTFGKAFGAAGAFVAGSEALMNHLVNGARSFIYSTALSPLLAATVDALWFEVMESPARRRRLAANVTRFRLRATELGLPLTDVRGPIQPIIVGTADRACALRDRMLEAGFWVQAIRSPTVPYGSERLRVTLSARHDTDTIDRFVAALAEHWKVVVDGHGA